MTCSTFFLYAKDEALYKRDFVVMNKKTLILGFVVVILLAAIPLTLYLASQQQDVRSRADEVEPTPTMACTPPAAVSNVRINFPYCPSGGDCDLTQASCTWNAIADATQYNVSITEVDSGTRVKQETIIAPTTQTVFPVTINRTYRCDVTATNACGAIGGVGTVELLCAVEASTTPTTTPSPIPTSSPTLTVTGTPPPPTATVTPAINLSPTPVVLACGASPCDATNSCQLGLTCVQASNGQSYCAMPPYQAACESSPSEQNCCFAQATIEAPTATPMPTIASPGPETPILFSAGALLITIIGGILFFLL